MLELGNTTPPAMIIITLHREVRPLLSKGDRLRVVRPHQASLDEITPLVEVELHSIGRTILASNLHLFLVGVGAIDILAILAEDCDTNVLDSCLLPL